MAIYTSEEFLPWIDPSQSNPLIQQWGDAAAGGVGAGNNLLARDAAGTGVSRDPGAAARAQSRAMNAGQLSNLNLAAQTYAPLRQQELQLRNAANSIMTTSDEAAFLGGFTGMGGISDTWNLLTELFDDD